MDVVGRVTVDGQAHVVTASATVTDPAGGDWRSAFDTRDINGTITDWYRANTGHDPAMDYLTHSGTLTINVAWLAANLGNGRVSQEPSGRWLVERYHVLGTVRVNVDNVTLRNISQLGGLYGVQSQAGFNAAGIVIEHCTFDGNMVNGSTAINFGAATEPNQIRLRFCNFTGFRAGIYCFGGVTAEYCWSHDLHYTPGSHNTGASIRSRNVTLRRNLIADGNSSAISFYAENSPYTNILAQENILRLPESDTGPEIIMAKQYSTPLPGETRRLVGNLFYRGGVGGGGIAGDTFGFTEISGNINMAGDPVT